MNNTRIGNEVTSIEASIEMTDMIFSEKEGYNVDLIGVSTQMKKLWGAEVREE